MSVEWFFNQINVNLSGLRELSKKKCFAVQSRSSSPKPHSNASALKLRGLLSPPRQPSLLRRLGARVNQQN